MLSAGENPWTTRYFGTSVRTKSPRAGGKFVRIVREVRGEIPRPVGRSVDGGLATQYEARRLGRAQVFAGRFGLGHVHLVSRAIELVVRGFGGHVL
jgi:hypothetical protein